MTRRLRNLGLLNNPQSKDWREMSSQELEELIDDYQQIGSWDKLSATFRLQLEERVKHMKLTELLDLKE